MNEDAKLQLEYMSRNIFQAESRQNIFHAEARRIISHAETRALILGANLPTYVS